MHWIRSLIRRNKFGRIVREQVRRNDPPEARAAYDQLVAMKMPAWRSWGLLRAAYRDEFLLAEKEGRPFSRELYAARLKACLNDPDAL